MKTVCRLTCSMLLICFSTFIIAGCAKTPPKTEPARSPEAKAESETRKIIVAKVNDVELTMDQLVNTMNTIPELSLPLSETIEERKKRALDSLVLLELAYQRASEMGLTPDHTKIQTGVDSFKVNIGGEQAYADYLAKNNMTEEDAHAEVERGLTINAIYLKEVVDRVSVPEEDLKREYETNKHLYIKPEKVIIIDVYLLKNEGKASQKKAKDLRTMIKTKLKQDPWKLVLDGTFMVQNRGLRKDRHQALYDAARKLKLQEISGVIRDEQGILHIIKLKEYSPERPLTFEEAKPEMVGKLNGPFLEQRTHEWEQELKKDAKIVLMLDAAEQQKPEQKTP